MKSAQPAHINAHTNLSRPSATVDKPFTHSHTVHKAPPEKSSTCPNTKATHTILPKVNSGRVGTNAPSRRSASTDKRNLNANNISSLPCVYTSLSPDPAHEEHENLNESSVSHISTVAADEIAHQLGVHNELLSKQAQLLHTDSEQLQSHEASLSAQSKTIAENRQLLATHTALLEDLMRCVSAQTDEKDVTFKNILSEQGKRIAANEIHMKSQEKKLAELTHITNTMQDSISRLQDAILLLSDRTHPPNIADQNPKTISTTQTVFITTIGATLLSLSIITGITLLMPKWYIRYV